jgi:hypothetical protein
VTWVIACPSHQFGAGLLYSDIRVGTTDGAYFDGVRKVHFIGNHAALGFAGDIQTGFEIVGDCAGQFATDCADQEFGKDHQLVEGESRELTLIAPPSYHLDNVIRYAAARFNAASPARQAAGCELIVCGAETDSDYFGGVIPRIHTWKLQSPTFEPLSVERGASNWIGSGGAVDEYRRLAVDALAEPEQEKWSGFARWNIELGAKALGAVAIADAIDAHPTPDVSPHMHITTVEPGRIIIATNDVHRGSTSRKMPPHAETWEALIAMAKGQGYASRSLTA